MTLPTPPPDLALCDPFADLVKIVELSKSDPVPLTPELWTKAPTPSCKSKFQEIHRIARVS